MARGESVGVVVLYPELLGTYGDVGNALVMVERLRSDGYSPKLIAVHVGDPIPHDGDFYLLGGGEDGPQTQAAELLATSGGLARAKEHGAIIVGVCAGLQVLSQVFIGAQGRPHEGLGLLSAETVIMGQPRAVGELLARPRIDCGQEFFSGYENHRSGTVLFGDARPLGDVVAGTGNLRGAAVEGALEGNVICTYLHGPAFARNPGLVDYVLRMRVELSDRGAAVNGDMVRTAQHRLLNERVSAVHQELIHGSSRSMVQLWHRLRRRLGGERSYR